ncbi:MAG: hypothetical protein FIB08_07695 [Candidatus Methanoperedens sp.]|nr:hypothetical protein [Candidatus Methanoperedens sp.]
MKKKRQLSLAQALGNLSNIEPDKVIGMNVVFEVIKRNNKGTRPRKVLKQGTVTELQKTPGFVLIKNEKGSVYSRSLSQVWRDAV